MTAYMVLTHTIDDVDAFRGEYVPAIGPVMQKYGIAIVAVSLDTTALEGGANSAVVFRADSEATFRAFYADPEFQRAKQIRHAITSDRNMVVLPALDATMQPAPADTDHPPRA